MWFWLLLLLATATACEPGQVFYGGECQNCGAGSTSNGFDNCEPCPAPKWSPSGSPTCNFCPAGQASYDRMTCVPCLPGTIQDTDAGNFCTACAPGRANPNASVQAADCPILCASGQYSNSGALNCSNCTIGTYSANNGSSVCLSCAAGKFAGVSASYCTDCAPGRYSLVGGSSTCALCPTGHSTNNVTGSNATCTVCPPGTYAGAGSPTCIPCASGTVSGHYNTSTCYACKPGFYASSSTACTACPLGTYTNVSGASVCSACSVGAYTVDLGARRCVPCPAGTYLNATTCMACAAGTWSEAGATNCTTFTGNCPPAIVTVVYETLNFTCPSLVSLSACLDSNYTCRHTAVVATEDQWALGSATQYALWTLAATTAGSLAVLGIYLCRASRGIAYDGLK